MSTKLSNKNIANVILRCKEDPIYFILNYVKIQSPNMGGTVPFKLYPFQQDLLSNMKNEKRIVVNKSRQLGITTVAAGFCLWYCLFNTSQNVAAIATNLTTAKNFLSKVQFGYDCLPSWMKQIFPIKTNNATEITWENGSKVMATGSSSNALRGQAISWLIVDEAAFIEGFDGPDGIWASIFPVISTGGKVLMLSSPSGTSGVFYETFIKAKSNNNNWTYMELPWDVHPERDEEWFEDQKLAVGDERIIAQEYMCSFAASGDAVLSSELREYLNNIKRKANTNPNIADSRYLEWDRPVEGETYVLGADVSGGKSDDYSTIEVINAGTGMQVAEFQGKILPEDFAKLLIKVGERWNFGTICIENNAIAQATISRMIDVGYPKMYAENRFGMPEVINMYAGYDNDKYKIGFSTQENSRRRLITEMIQQMEKRRFTSFSEKLMNEFNTFVWTKGKQQAAKGCNDDLVMAWSFAIWCRETTVGFAESKQKMTEIMANSVSIEIKTNELNFMSDLRNNHRNEQGIYNRSSNSYNPNSSRYNVDMFSAEILGYKTQTQNKQVSERNARLQKSIFGY